MTLRIRKAEEPIKIEHLNLCIYAPPGVGKTSLAQTADSPLTLDFDKGIYRCANRRDSVECNRWADVAGMDADDLAEYKTIIVDTAGRALDKLSLDIISDNPKLGKKDGALSLQGYGVLKSRFSAWVKLLNSFGKDVVELCHMDEQRNGDDVIERLDAQGSSKNEIYKTADAMGRIFVRNGKRYLDFSPREGAFGKNPGQLAELEIPHPSTSPRFLAETIQAIKDKLNEMTEEQRQVQAAIDEWTSAINDLKDPDAFNQMLPGVSKAPEMIREYFKKRVAAVGFKFAKGVVVGEAVSA